MGHDISYSYGTRKGRRHENNEDSILVIEQGGVFVFGVFDGISGLHDGANASKVAMEFIRDNISAKVNTALIKEQPKDYLLYLIKGAHNRIRQFEGDAQMGTTATLCLIDGDGYLHTIHVGDSPLFLAWEGYSVKLSDDDSICGKLTKYLGMPGELNLDTAYCKRKVQSGILALCTDGLMDGVGADWLSDLSGTLIDETTAPLVIDQAYESSCSGDDISLILVKIIGDEFSIDTTRENPATAIVVKKGKWRNFLSFSLVFVIGALAGCVLCKFCPVSEHELLSPTIVLEQTNSELTDTINTHNYEYE